MSENDEGKSKTFYWLRVMAIISRTKVRSLRKALRDAEQEHLLRQRRLQEVCPHSHITECKRYFEDAGGGHDYTDIIIPTMRWCGDCNLLEDEHLKGGKLFGRAPDRVVSEEEFRRILQDARS